MRKQESWQQKLRGAVGFWREKYFALQVETERLRKLVSAIQGPERNVADLIEASGRLASAAAQISVSATALVDKAQKMGEGK